MKSQKKKVAVAASHISIKTIAKHLRLNQITPTANLKSDDGDGANRPTPYYSNHLKVKATTSD